MGLLRDNLPRHTYGVVGTYLGDDLVAAVVAVSIEENDDLVLQFPKTHTFSTGDSVTVQLDNRMSVPRITEELPIHRVSYKGIVTATEPGFIEVRPLQFAIVYSDRLVAEYKDPGYVYPAAPRPEVALEESAQRPGLAWRSDDAQTNLGVLFTRAPERPHSTVMAFLSAGAGDVFLVTRPQSFKARNIVRHPRVLFAVDYRASYDLSKPLDWSYRLLSMKVHKISPGPLHTEVTQAFLTKNPWNSGFFAAPGSLLLHLVPERV